MSFKAFRYLILSDLYRIHRDVRLRTLLRELLFGDSYKYVFWLRTSQYAQRRRGHRLLLYPLARLFLHHYGRRLGIGIPVQVDIGPGFYISHFTGVFVNSNSTIGRNCNISQGVTLGLANRGPRKGVPSLGDNVYLGPGAKVVGKVRIGNNVAVGANAVVTRDLPDSAVAVGIPAKVISFQGSANYVARTGYEELLGPTPSELAAPTPAAPPEPVTPQAPTNESVGPAEAVSPATSRAYEAP